MKCISLWQPWATLMTIGAKRNETRSWPTSYRGILAIHAAKRWTRNEWSLSTEEPFSTALIGAGFNEKFLHLAATSPDQKELLPLGMILAVVNVVDCVQIVPANMPDDPEFEFGDYTPGRFMWQTDRARRLIHPIPYRGAQGIFNLPSDVILEDNLQ